MAQGATLFGSRRYDAAKNTIFCGLVLCDASHHVSRLTNDTGMSMGVRCAGSFVFTEVAAPTVTRQFRPPSRVLAGCSAGLNSLLWVKRGYPLSVPHTARKADNRTLLSPDSSQSLVLYPVCVLSSLAF